MSETRAPDEGSLAGTEIPRRRQRMRPPVGAAPGTLVANPHALPTTLNLTLIAPGRAEFLNGVSLEVVEEKQKDYPLLWLDCVGLADIDLLEDVGELFGLHPLALEDAVNTGQRPKADFYEKSVFIVVSMIDEVASRRQEQISLFIGEHFVVTFQERPGDPFDAVRRRIKGGSPLCERKGDFLAYTLIDAIVDSFFPVIDAIGEGVDGTEDAVFNAPDINNRRVLELHKMRRDVVLMKRTLWPLRDALAGLGRTDSPLVTAETKLFLSDTLDHAVRLIETLETFRDTLTGLIEIDLALAQARTNDTIGFLTIVSAIFIPLTFLAGIWGMNFDPHASPWNMPELEAAYGYPAALLLMAAVAVGLIVYFRKKKWLRFSSGSRDAGKL